MPAFDLNDNDLFTTSPGDPERKYGTLISCADLITKSISTTARRDSVDEMWTMYMEEIKEEDSILVDGWKSGANNTVVFVRSI